MTGDPTGFGVSGDEQETSAVLLSDIEAVMPASVPTLERLDHFNRGPQTQQV